MRAPFFARANVSEVACSRDTNVGTRRRRNDGQGRQPTRGACRTVDEVASALGLSRQRVQQLEASALRKLRASGLLRELANV